MIGLQKTAEKMTDSSKQELSGLASPIPWFYGDG
jgi:hypothetical protein